MSKPSIAEFKLCAKRLKAIFESEHSLELPHGQWLEILSKGFGLKNWNTFSAISSSSESTKPLGKKAKIGTVGELIEKLKGFDPETRFQIREEFEVNGYDFYGEFSETTSDWTIEQSKDGKEVFLVIPVGADRSQEDLSNKKK